MTNPSIPKPTTLGLSPSFGFGDRLGLATPGHLAALDKHGGPIRGVFAQQSIREMQRTDRNPTLVMNAATQALAADGARPLPHGEWGADADHLKTAEDIESTAEAGFVFYTIDPSDYVEQRADSYSDAEIHTLYTPTPWIQSYRGQTVSIPNGPTIVFEEPLLKRAAVKYGKAITQALKLAVDIKSSAERRNQPYEIEVSVDETDQPTTLVEHYLIAELLIKGVDGHPGLGDALVSLAPRFIGELEKGVDYIGDIPSLEASLRDHAAIARFLGPYKLSLHSGSDKLSIYGPLAQATEGLFHVKTAGTSYLEALRVVSVHDPVLFRRIIDFSRDRYDADRATYHVHATNDRVPAPSDIPDDHELVGQYLEHWKDVVPGKGFAKPGRQILHCTFGSVMCSPEYSDSILQILREHADTHRDILVDHFGRHLKALNA